MYGSADNTVAIAYAQENNVEYVIVDSREDYEALVNVDEFTDDEATRDEVDKLGDVNFDGQLNIKDATAIQKHLADLLTLDSKAIALADFDADGKITIKDATAIQKFIAGLI